MSRELEAIELMRKLNAEGVSIRISNKSASGYWWVYLTPKWLADDRNDPDEYKKRNSKTRQ